MSGVTRVEIAQQITEAFRGSAATKEQIMEAAERSNTRPEVVAVLERLPQQTYGHLRDLWVELHQIPVGP
ncbi:MAG TPA: hypothetical protein DCY40_02660 [Actinobacteria bacterium]|nr:hypothetical protein [Actinomycetota bacterium]